MSRNVLITLALAILAAFGAGAYIFMYGLPWASGQNGAAGNGNTQDQSEPNQVVALGRLAPAGGIYSIGAIPGELLEEVKVEPGSAVDKTTVVAVLMSSELRRLEVESLEKQLAEAEKRVAAETKVADSRIDLADLSVQQASAGKEKIAAQEKQIALLKDVHDLELKRFENLKKVTSATESQRDVQELVVQKAAVEHQAAEAALITLKHANEFGLKTAEAEADAARAAKEQVLSGLSVESLSTRLAQARKQHELTRIKSPIKGVVLNVFSKAGEVVGPQRIMTVANLDRMVCRAEVYQDDVRRLRDALEKANGKGLTVYLTSDAFENKYYKDHAKDNEKEKNENGKKAADKKRSLIGKLKDASKIGRVVSPPVTDPTDPFARNDVEVVEVEIEIEGLSREIAASYVNLQVNVVFPLTTVEQIQFDTPRRPPGESRE